MAAPDAECGSLYRRRRPGFGEGSQNQVPIRRPADQSTFLVLGATEDPGLGKFGEGAVCGGRRPSEAGDDPLGGQDGVTGQGIEDSQRH